MNTPTLERTTPRATGERRDIGAVLLIYFLAGAASLILETAWLRLFGTVYGLTAFGVAPVIAAFVGALGLGALVLGMIADRRPDPLRIFAFSAIAAGITSLATRAGIALAPGLIGGSFGASSGTGFGFSLAAFGVSFATIGVPAFLMGGGLPLLARHAARAARAASVPVAILYGVNTAGAVLGTLFTAYYAIDTWGVKATVLLGGVIEIAAGLAGLLLARASSPLVNEPVAMAEPAPPADTTPAFGPASGTRAAVLAATAIGGFAAMAAEVLWTRVLGFAIDSTVYAFATMLAVYLAGLAAGSLVASAVVARGQRPLIAMGAIQGACGLAILGSVSTLARWPSVGERLADLAGHSTLFRWNTERALQAAAFVLVPAVLFGALIPLAVRALTPGAHFGARDGRSRIGRMVGTVSAINAAGGVLGALSGGVLLAPAVGTDRALLLVAFVSVLAGLLLIMRSAEAPRRSRIGFSAALLLVFLTGRGLLPEHAMNTLFNARDAGSELLGVREGPGTIITIHRYPGIRTLSVNGITAAGSDLVMSTTQRLEGHLPALLHPSPRTALTIGAGSGETARVLLLDGLEHVDAVDVASGLAASANQFSVENAAVFQDRRCRLIEADGRAFLRYAAARYDLIVNDPTHPALAGAGSLFTQEHFEACRAHLAPGGIMATWVPLFALRGADFATVVRTFTDVFPHATLWYAGNCLNRHALLIARAGDQPLTIDWSALVARTGRPEVAADLAGLNLGDTIALLDCYVTGEEALRALAASGEVNRDDRPVLEFRAPRIIGRDSEVVANLVDLVARNRGSVFPLLTNFGPAGGDPALLQPALERGFAGTTQVLRGIALDIRGVSSEPERAYRAALALNPDDPHAKFFLQDKVVQEAALTQAVAANPEDRDARLELARVQMKQGKYQEALASFAASQPAEVRDASVWYDMGLCEARLNHAADAEHSYREAIRLNSGLPEAHVNLGALLQRNGRYEDAVAEYKAALAIVPLHPEANYDLGVAYAQKGLHMDAIVCFEAAIRARPAYAEAWYNLGISRATTGDLPGAVAAWESCLRLDPGNQLAQANLARARNIMSGPGAGSAPPPNAPQSPSPGRR